LLLIGGAQSIRTIVSGRPSAFASCTNIATAELPHDRRFSLCLRCSNEMQNDRSQPQWLSLDMPINQYPPPDPELVRQSQREQEPRYEPQSWAHRGLSYPPPQVPAAEQQYYGQGQQGENISSGSCIGESQGTIPSYPAPSGDDQQTMESTQKPRVDWLEGVPEMQALLSAQAERRSLQVTDSEVEEIAPQPSSVPMIPANQRLILEIPSQERGCMRTESHEGGIRGRQHGHVHKLGTPSVRQELDDRPHRTASMAIRDLIEPTSPRDTIDRIPRPPALVGGGGPELLAYVRRWSAPGATAESAKISASDIGTAPTFHVTGAESHYLYASRVQEPASDYTSAAPRPRLIPGHYYYDSSVSSSPSPYTQLQYGLEPGYPTTTSAGRAPAGSPARYRVEPSASLPPAPHGHQYTSAPATFRPETTQLDPDPHVPLSRSPAPLAQLLPGVELQPGSYSARREPSPHPRSHRRQSLSPYGQVCLPRNEDCIHGPAESHAYTNPPSSRPSHDHDHRYGSQLGYPRTQDRNYLPSPSPHSQTYTSDTGSTRRESSQDPLSPTTSSRSSSVATSLYPPAFTLQPTTTPSFAKNLKSTPYYATLRPGPAGSKQAWLQTGPWPLGNAIREPPTPLPPLPEASKPLPSSRRRRGSSRPRHPTSTRSMPNLLYMSEVGSSVRDAFSPQRQTVISEEPSQTDIPQGFSSGQSGAHTIGTLTPRGHETDAVMREAPPLLDTIMDARLKSRTPSENTAQISSRGADAWRLHAPQEPPRRAKSVEDLGGRASQYPVSAVRDQPGPVRGSRDRSPSRGGTCSSFSQQELETGMILQEMYTGGMEATPAGENIPQPADLVIPAIPGPAREHGGVGVQPAPPAQLTIATETYRNPFVLIDCALAFLRYSRSRFFVANGPLMQNNFTELAESINYLGTEMQRIESTFTGQAMREWINTVYNVEEYKDLERLTRYIGKGHNLVL